MEISATVIAHSKSSVNGKEIITFELVYPRWIHGELLTHRMFSRNAASSRAIPVKKMIDMVRTDPAMPVHWGKNQPGMQANEELTGDGLSETMGEWMLAAHNAADSAEFMTGEGAHKQIVNRILEPFQWMKTIVTATEYENFFWLRNHEDAQPEIKRLAEFMMESLDGSGCVTLRPGDWHVPYYNEGYWRQGNRESSPLEDALAISSSCCAQVSYRLLDDSLEKAKMIYSKLVESEPVHASPFEHQASPMEIPTIKCIGGTLFCEEGQTHIDKDDNYWSGNFKSWIQHRNLIPNNYKEG